MADLDRKALGIPELWRFDGTSFRVSGLRADGTHEDRESSLAFPFLPLGEVAPLLTRGATMDQLSWGRMVRNWVRGLPRGADR